MKLKKMLALLLALVMTMSLVTLPSYAEDEERVAPVTAAENVTVADSTEPTEDAAPDGEEAPAEAPAEKVTPTEDAENPAEDVTHAEDAFSTLTVQEQYAAIMAMDDEAAIEAAFAELTEEQQNALVEYAAAQEEPAEQREYTVPQTVVFTEAGPFMPAVSVTPVRKMMKAMSTPMNALGAVPMPDADGLEFKKTAKDNGDGTYTITMEAWATGSSVTTTSTKPVDIVLVLDQSGSMAYDFNGDSTSINSNRRQYAMKQAVNSFVNAVNAKYDAQESDHRMAIVTFSSSASTLQGWTAVNDAGKTALQNKINGLPNSPSGGTLVGTGMSQAETLMGSGYNYTGSNTERQKVVILFTDGVPGNSGFDSGVANSAITSAKALKDAGVTVYSVGIFAGANPNQMYGDRQFFANLGMTFEDVILHKRDVWAYSDGSINSQWEVRNGFFARDYDVSPIDVPAGNRFLNFISSNYKGTDEIGIKSIDTSHGLAISYGGFKITKNFDRTASNYYLTAADSTGLNNIFETISQQMDSSSTTLDSKAVVKDVVSKYFKAPANTSDIKLYTAAAKADGAFENRVSAPSAVKATVSGDTVSVTGFDFAKEFVSDTKKSDNTYGKKLIIEFTVSPKDGFPGGNGVPTNGEAAVYDKDGTKVEEKVSPVVDVAIKPVTVTAVDKNVYLTNSLTEAQLLKGVTVKCGNVDITNPSTLQDWQKAYVTIADSASGLTNLMADTTYTVNASVTPINSGSATKQTDSATAKVNVFAPDVNFKDSTIHRGNTAVYSVNQPTSVTWKHDGKLDSAVTMTGTKPTLTYDYNKAAAAFTDCTDVNAFVKIGTTDVTAKTTGDKQFTVHVLQPTITASVKDVEKYYGESYTLGDDADGKISLSWADKHTEHNGPAASDTAPYTKGNLSLKYSTTAFSGQTGIISAAKDFDVNVKVMNGTQEMKDAIITTTCTLNKGCKTPDTDGFYTVHVATCTLIVNKSGCSDLDYHDANAAGNAEYQSFIFDVAAKADNKVKVDDIKVVVQGDGQAKITGLPVGKYTVTEDEAWSWRYEAADTGSATLDSDHTTGSVTISNNRTKDKWLSGDNYANNFDGMKACGTFVSGN